MDIGVVSIIRVVGGGLNSSKNDVPTAKSTLKMNLWWTSR